MKHIDYSNIEYFSNINTINGTSLMCKIKLKDNPQEIITHEKYLSDFCKKKLYREYVTSCLKNRTQYEWR